MIIKKMIKYNLTKKYIFLKMYIYILKRIERMVYRKNIIFILLIYNVFIFCDGKIYKTIDKYEKNNKNNNNDNDNEDIRKFLTLLEKEKKENDNKQHTSIKEKKLEQNTSSLLNRKNNIDDNHNDEVKKSDRNQDLKQLLNLLEKENKKHEERVTIKKKENVIDLGSKNLYQNNNISMEKNQKNTIKNENKTLFISNDHENNNLIIHNNNNQHGYEDIKDNNNNKLKSLVNGNNNGGNVNLTIYYWSWWWILIWIAILIFIIIITNLLTYFCYFYIIKNNGQKYTQMDSSIKRYSYTRQQLCRSSL